MANIVFRFQGKTVLSKINQNNVASQSYSKIVKQSRTASLKPLYGKIKSRK